MTDIAIATSPGVPRIITVLEGKRELKSREEAAARHLRESDKEFSRGIATLWSIRDDNLWQYHEDDDGVLLMDRPGVEFGDYLRSFCTKYGLSRSGTYDHLRTVRVWTEVLGLELNQLVEAGVKRSKSLRNIIDVDGRTGKVTTAPPSVIENLPPGNTDLDRIKKKVEETLIDPPIELPPKEVRNAFTIDVGMKDEKIFYEEADGTIVARYAGPELDDNWTGTVIPADISASLHDVIKRHIFTRLGVVTHDPGNDDG